MISANILLYTRASEISAWRKRHVERLGLDTNNLEKCKCPAGYHRNKWTPICMNDDQGASFDEIIEYFRERGL